MPSLAACCLTSLVLAQGGLSPAPAVPAAGLPPAAAAASSNEPLRLQPPRPREAVPLPERSERPARGGAHSAATVGSSLAVVLAAFLLLAWLARKKLPGGVPVLPGEAVAVLGRRTLLGKQQMYLVRCGNKLLLLCVSPLGAETLTEITDPAEVDRLAGLAAQASPHGATATFRNLLEEMGRQPADPNDVAQRLLAPAGR